jgi:aspartyl/asparaginyl beta-hydroxylase (cupin superfamily)
MQRSAYVAGGIGAVVAALLLGFSVDVRTKSSAALQRQLVDQQAATASYNDLVAAESVLAQARSDAHDQAAAVRAARMAAIAKQARDSADARLASEQEAMHLADGTRWRNRDASSALK